MITVLSGVNTQAIREKLQLITSNFKKKHGTSGIEHVNGERIDLDAVSSLISGATLFALERLVIIRGLAENKAVAEQFLTRLDQISEQTHIVLVEGQLDKRTVFYKTLKNAAEFYEFAELDEVAATKLVQDVARREGGVVNQPTARLIVHYVGTDQSRLTNEVLKLVAYDTNITESSVEALVEKRPEETIFQLLEYALNGKSQQALEVLDALERAREDPFQAASMLIWQTHILAVVHSAPDVPDAEIAKNTKLNPFVVRKTRSIARNLDRTRLRGIISAVAECDVKLKSTSSDPWRIVEQTILSFSTL